MVWKHQEPPQELWNHQPQHRQKPQVFFEGVSVPELYESGLNYTPADPNTKANLIADSGAFVAFSGGRTGYFFT